MSKSAPEELTLGGFPRVDLLPAAAREAIRRRPIVRRLIVGVALFAVVVLAAVVGATLLSLASAALLQAERDRSTTLINQQLEFADARAVDLALKESVAAQKVATLAESDWNALIAEIRASLPAGVNLSSVEGSILVDGDEDAGNDEPEPLRQESVGSFAITATSPTVPDVEAWLERLADITGFAGIAPPVSVSGSDGAGYEVEIEVLINEGVFIGRFLEPTEEEG